MKPAKKNETMPMSTDSGVLMRLHQIGHAITKRMSQNSPLPPAAGVTLLKLRIASTALEPAEVARENGIPRQTITAALDTLEKAKLAVRTPHPHDRRRKQIQLTPKGKQMADRVIQDLRFFELQAYQTLSAKEQIQFSTLLSRYADALSRVTSVTSST